jgi:hypothetical protein
MRFLAGYGELTGSLPLGERPVQLRRDEVQQVLKRAGLPDVSREVEKALPEQFDEQELERFLAPYGITKQFLVERMGGSL